MKIVGVKTFVVGNPPPHRGGRNWVFLKLMTDEGIEGVGECNVARDREHALVQLIKDLCEPFVIGTDPFDTEKLWDRLYSSTHFFRHPGIVSTQVVAAFEMACWDIVGKALNQPVYNLLGGKYNERSAPIPTSTSGTAPSRPKRLERPRPGSPRRALPRSSSTRSRSSPRQGISPSSNCATWTR